MNKILPRVVENFLINKTRQHFYSTRGNSLDVLQVKTTYGSNSFTIHAIHIWNFFKNELSITTLLPNITSTKFLKVIKTYISEKA